MQRRRIYRIHGAGRPLFLLLLLLLLLLSLSLSLSLSPLLLDLLSRVSTRSSLSSPTLVDYRMVGRGEAGRLRGGIGNGRWVA